MSLRTSIDVIVNPFSRVDRQAIKSKSFLSHASTYYAACEKIVIGRLVGK